LIADAPRSETVEHAPCVFDGFGNLRNPHKHLGEARRAIEVYEQALAIAREIGDRRGEANHAWNLGLAVEAQGDYARAAALMEVLVAVEREMDHPDAERHAQRLEEVRRRAGGAG
jgi:tetratricopeptide (TPR) repeat protein